MKKIFHLILCALCICALAACSNPNDIVLGADPMKTIEANAEAIKKLSEEDRKLLIYSVGMSQMAGIFASKGEPNPLAGLTIGEVLGRAKKKKAETEAKNKESEELRKKVEAQTKLMQEEFQKILTVALVNKRNVMQEYGRRFVNLDMAYENKGNKDIQGVKGVLRVTDIFGDKILNVRWSYDKGIKAGKTATEKNVGIDINQFKDDDMKLWNTDFDKLKSSFDVQTIIFVGGEKLQVTQE